MFNIDISLDHIIFPKYSNKRENLFDLAIKFGKKGKHYETNDIRCLKTRIIFVHQIKTNFDFNLPNCDTNPLTTAIINKNEEAIKLLLNTNANLFYESPRFKLMPITILFRTNYDVEQLFKKN